MISAKEARNLSDHEIPKIIEEEINKAITNSAEKGDTQARIRFLDDTEANRSLNYFIWKNGYNRTIINALKTLGYEVSEIDRIWNDRKYQHHEHYLIISW